MFFVVALVALGTDAFAGCTKPPCAAVKWYSGSCICCTTGSEVFNFTAVGVPGWFVKDCPVINGVQQNCVSCSVYGTAGDPSTCDPLAVPNNCGVEGVLFCVNHGGNAAKAQGQPFTLSASVSASGNFTSCDKAGKCKGSIQVTGDLSSLSDQCQNPNWTAIAFTASRFNGECCTCNNGYDVDGQCCADATRNPDGTCGNGTATQTCTVEGFRCSINPVPQPGDMQPYQCCALSDVDPVTGNCPAQ
jgi:hypothetical protein